MKSVLVFFLMLACFFGAWRLADRRQRKAVRKSVRPMLAPVVLAGLVVAVLLAFAFNFNGKFI